MKYVSFFETWYIQNFRNVDMFFFFEKTSKESIQKNYMLEIVNYIFILLYIISIKVVQLFCQVYEQFRPVVKCINKKT